MLYQMKHEAQPSVLCSDKARIASILNSFENDPFYIHLVSLFAKELAI